MSSCEICRNEAARYVCSNCGRSVGAACFQKEGWLCIACSKQETYRTREVERGNSAMATTLLFIAFLMIFAGVTLLLLSGAGTGQGGFVVIFPFFFASSGGSNLILIPTIAIVALMIILTLLSLRRSKRM